MLKNFVWLNNELIVSNLPWNWHMPFRRQLFYRQSKYLYWIPCQFFSIWCVLFLWWPLRRLRQEPRPTNSYNNPQHSYARRKYEKWGMRWRVVISLGMLILFKWWASKAVVFMFWSSNSRWMAISLMSDAQNSIVEKPWLNFREAITLSSNLSGIGFEVLYYGANFWEFLVLVTSVRRVEKVVRQSHAQHLFPEISG